MKLSSLFRGCLAKMVMLCVAFVCSLCAQQTSIGGATSSGASSEGHQGGSSLSLPLAVAASLSDAVVVHHRFVANLTDSMSIASVVGSAHRLPLAVSLQAADSVIVDYIANYRPTNYLDSGIDQNGNPSPCSNDGSAIDGNPATATICSATRDPGFTNFTNKQVLYYGFPSKRGSPASITLNVISSATVNANCSAFRMGMQYSLNGGSAWTNVPGQFGAYSQNTATIPISSSQDLTQVKVQGLATCTHTSSGSGLATLNINEIWIVAE